MQIARTTIARLASFGVRFWFFLLGLFLVWLGAHRASPSLAWMLCGLLIIWDLTRDQPGAPPGK